MKISHDGSGWNRELFFELFHENDAKADKAVARLISCHYPNDPDAAREVYRKTISLGLKKFRKSKAPRFFSWILEIADFAIREKMRKTRKEKRLYRDLSEQKLTILSYVFDEPFPEKRKMNEDDHRIANEIVDSLPSDCRDYFIFRELLGMNYDEIADYFDVSEQTAFRRVHEAKTLLSALSRQYIIGALSSRHDHEHFLALSRQVFEQALDLTADMEEETEEEAKSDSGPIPVSL